MHGLVAPLMYAMYFKLYRPSSIQTKVIMGYRVTVCILHTLTLIYCKNLSF